MYQHINFNSELLWKILVYNNKANLLNKMKSSRNMFIACRFVYIRSYLKTGGADFLFRERFRLSAQREVPLKQHGERMIDHKE